MEFGFGESTINKHMRWWMNMWALDLLFGVSPWWRWRKKKFGELNWIHVVMNSGEASMRWKKRCIAKRARLPEDAENSPTNSGIRKRLTEDMEVIPTEEDKSFNPYPPAT